MLWSTLYLRTWRILQLWAARQILMRILARVYFFRSNSRLTNYRQLPFLELMEYSTSGLGVASARFPLRWKRLAMCQGHFHVCKPRFFAIIMV